MALSPDGSDEDEASSATSSYLLKVFWRYRYFIAMVTGVLMVASLVFASLTTPTYNATVVAYPASNSSVGPTGGLGSIVSRIGLGGGALGDPFDLSTPVFETIALLQSREIAFKLFKKENMLPELFYRKWDPARNTWKEPTLIQKWIAQITGKDPHATPSYDDAFEAFDQIRTVTRDDISGVITVSVSWRDPKLAAEWANQLVQVTDDALRNQQLAESHQSLDYLSKQAQSASLLDLRDAVYGVAEKTLTQSMLASVKQNFAIRVLDPARPPLRPSWPRTAFLLAMALAGGLFLGFAAALAMNNIEEARRRAGMPEGEPLPDRLLKHLKFWRRRTDEDVAEQSA